MNDEKLAPLSSRLVVTRCGTCAAEGGFGE
jgi:hypothetical protein